MDGIETTYTFEFGSDFETTDEDHTADTVNVLENDKVFANGVRDLTYPLRLIDAKIVGSIGLDSVDADLETGNVTYDPGTAYQYLAVGEQAFVFIECSIDDGLGSTAVTLLRVTVTGQNDPSTASPDGLTTNEDDVASLQVLANDTDIDTSDVPKLKVTTASIQGGGLGSVQVPLDGKTISYNPGNAYNHFTETDTAIVLIDYTISDPYGSTDSSLVTLTVQGVNDYARRQPRSGRGDDRGRRDFRPGAG